MSLLMQALKKAEHAKQKNAPLDEGGASRQQRVPDLAPAMPEVTKEVDFPAIDHVLVQEPAPELPSVHVRRTESPAKEPQFSLAGIEPSPSSMTLQPLALSAPGNEAGLPQLSTPPGFGQSQPADEVKAEALETVAPPPESPNKPTRSNIPRASEEQKRAAAQEAEMINQAQQKAKSVFTAKQKPRSSRFALIAGGATIVLMLCAGAGFYFWQIAQLDSAQAQFGVPPGNPMPRPVVAPPTTVAKVAPTTSTQTDQLAPLSQSATATMQLKPNQAVPIKGLVGNDMASESGGTLKAVASLPESTGTGQPHSQTEQKTEQQRGQSAQVAAADKIQIHKGTAPTTISAALNSAYKLFATGDVKSAQPLYENVLREEPNNRDALLGMAAISLNQNQNAQAGSFYSKLLDLDPSDPDAIAGLTSLRNGDPEQSESILKKVLAHNPQSGAALFELGNLYAQQKRWGEAQQSYFRAYTTAPGNADYAFNLAVSLDQLNQAKLALQYYRQALSLSKASPSKFKQSAAQDRVTQLRGATPEPQVE